MSPEKVMLIILTLSNGVMGIMCLKAIFQRDDAHEKIRSQQYWFDAMYDFVFEHAKFPDKSGIADGEYNSKEVEAKWNVVHAINQEFRELPKIKGTTYFKARSEAE